MIPMDGPLFFLVLNTLATIGGAFYLGWLWGQARLAGEAGGIEEV